MDVKGREHDVISRPRRLRMTLTFTEMEQSGKSSYFPGPMLHKPKETVSATQENQKRGVEVKLPKEV